MKKCILKVALILSAALFFNTSCSNFLGGYDLKKDIEQTIAYEKLETRTVTIKGNEEAIQFLAFDGNFYTEKVKKSDKLEIQFTVNCDDFEFIDWNIYSTTTTDKIQSEMYKTQKVGDVYTSYLDFKDDCDITLEVNCYELPAVKSITPEYYPTGISCYRNIEIEFTQPMKESELSDFSYIKIYDINDKDLSSCFEKPVLKNENKTLIIRPKTEAILKLLEKSNLMDIFVYLPTKLHEDSATPHPFKELTYNYVITRIQDTSNPVINKTSFQLERNLLDFTTNQYNKEVLSAENDNSNFNKDFYYNNHISDRIYITAEGTDIGSGVRGLKITEQKIGNLDGTDSTGSKSNALIQDFILNDENTYELNSYEYVLNSEDGLIKLDFCLVDYDNHESEHITRYVIKESAISATIDINIDSKFEMLRGNYDGIDVLYCDKNGKGDFKLKAYSTFYKQYNSQCKITVSYWNEGEDPVCYETFTGSKGKEEYYESTKGMLLKANSVSYIEITLESETGLKTEKTYLIPAASYFGEYIFDNGSETTPSECAYMYLEPESVDLKDYTLSYEYLYFGEGDASGNIPEERLLNGKKEAEYNSNTGKYVIKLYKGHDYLIYKRSVYKNKSQNSFYSPVSAPLSFKIDSNKKFIPDCISDSVSFEYPKIKASVSAPVPNAGVHTVNVNYNTAIPEYDDYTFQIYYFIDDADGEKYINYPASNTTFNVVSGHKYKIGMAWIDKYNNIVQSKTAECPEIDASTKNFEINTSDMYFAIGINSYSFASEKYMFNNCTLEYYIEKNSYPNSPAPDFSEEKIKKLEKHSATGYLGNGGAPEALKLDLDLEDSFYTIYYKLINNEANGKSFGCGSAVISAASTSNDIGSLSISKTSSTQYSVNVPANYTSTVYWLNSNTWEYESMQESTTLDSRNITAENSTNFTKVVLTEGSNKYGYPEYYGKTIYLYPDYFLNDHTYSKKDFIEGKFGYTIFIDQPTLVRTLCSKYNWGDDPEIWGTRGYENDICVKNSDFTYIPKIDNLEDGYYYCTVVNFADGTSCMSDVKIK